MTPMERKAKGLTRSKVKQDLNSQMLKEHEKFRKKTVTKAKSSYNKSLNGKASGDESFVEKIVDKKHKGYTPKERFVKLGAKEANQRNAVIEKGIKNGESYEQIATKLQQREGITKSAADRIARTEGHRIVEESTFKGYDDLRSAGITNFRVYWSAAKDGRTREEHSKLDGKHQNDDGYFVVGQYKGKYPGGFGYPEMDVNCRCSTYILFDT